MLEQRRPVVPGHVLRVADDVVAVEGRDRDDMEVGKAERLELGADLLEPVLRPVDEVHLVDGDGHVRGAEDRDDVGVTACLLDDALPRVEQDHGDVGGRRARDHVARVLHVARRVRELEPSPRGHERAVGDVDRDPLLALGAQPVGEQGEVDGRVAAPATRLLDVLELVDVDLLRVVEQPPDQRRLAVVDGPAGDEPEQLGLQLRLRSSQRASCPPSPPR